MLRRFRPDWLEPRCLLATGLPGIISVALDTSTNPPQVEITFDQNDVAQIDNMLAPLTGMSGNANFSVLLNVLDSAADFEIDQTGSDGSFVAEVLGPNAPPAIENVTDGAVAGVQAVQVAIPLSGLQVQPGHYQIQIEGSTTLDFLFDLIDPGIAWDALASSFQPMVIGQFTIYGQGASFQNATPLPTPAAAVTTVTGLLNPDDYRSAVDIYQFTLGATPSNLWEVGFALEASDIGSPLQADLTLFGPDGQVVATALSGTGLPGDPGDPYLFAGLQPGTYYIAISGAGYLPYGPTGYNPELGIPGVLGFHQPDGMLPFELSFAAIPHLAPTTVTGSWENWLDPLSSSPTSVTLDFSGPIDLNNLFVVDQAEGALELVDSSGRVWPITPESYDIRTHQLTMVVDDPLPGGEYRLTSPSTDPLTDLAGQPVIAPGEPPGVLAAFYVAPSSGQSLPGDLGVVWPNQIGVAPASIGDTLNGSVALQPGQSATYRFVATVPGLYQVQTVVNSGAVAVQELGSTGTITLDTGSASHINDYIMTLADGVYQIRFIDVGVQPAEFSWRLKIGSVDWEKIIGNGVGQGAALALELMSTPATLNSSTSPAPDFAGALAFQGVNVGDGPAGPISSSMFITLDSAPLGQPGAIAASLATVGPTVDGALVAVADNAQGLVPNIRYVSTDQASSDAGPDAPAIKPDQLAGQAKGAGLAQAANRLDPAAATIQADERALLQGEWLVRLAGIVRNWFGPRDAGGLPAASGLEDDESLTILRAGPGPEDRLAATSPRRILDRTARSDIEFPAGLLVIAVAAYRLQHPVRRWWRKRLPARAKSHRRFGPAYPSPHSSSTFGRVTTRIHK